MLFARVWASAFLVSSETEVDVDVGDAVDVDHLLAAVNTGSSLYSTPPLAVRLRHLPIHAFGIKISRIVSARRS